MLLKKSDKKYKEKFKINVPFLLLFTTLWATFAKSRFSRFRAKVVQSVVNSSKNGTSTCIVSYRFLIIFLQKHCFLHYKWEGPWTDLGRSWGSWARLGPFFFAVKNNVFEEKWSKNNMKQYMSMFNFCCYLQHFGPLLSNRCFFAFEQKVPKVMYRAAKMEHRCSTYSQKFKHFSSKTSISTLF